MPGSGVSFSDVSDQSCDNSSISVVVSSRDVLPASVDVLPGQGHSTVKPVRNEFIILPHMSVDGATLDIPEHVTGEYTPHSVRLPTFPHCPDADAPMVDRILDRPGGSKAWSDSEPLLADIYRRVVDIGVPNYRGARCRVPSDLNIDEWRKSEHLLQDRSLVDCLAFGFPVGFTGLEPPQTGIDNHSSARMNPEQIAKYIATERSHKAMVGPYSLPLLRHGSEPTQL